MTTVQSESQSQIIEVEPFTQEITVDPVTQVAIVVESSIGTVNVVSAGPQGPPGFGTGFNFTQNTDSDFWVINHNLGYNPAVQTFSIGGLEVLGEVHHVSSNQVTVSFNTPISGSARLN